MPKWFAKAIFYLIVLGLILVSVVIALGFLQVKTHPVTPESQATVNATAIARFTPTPGFSSAQNATAVYLAKPTPYIEWTPGDAQVFINAMRDKAYTQTKNLVIAAELGAPGAGWQCIQIGTDILGVYTIMGDTYCRISLTWTDWQLVINPEQYQIQVEEGRHVQIPAVDAQGNNYFQERALAKVTITVKEVGLNSPGTRFDQRFDFYKDLNGAWNLSMDLKKIFFGDDLRQQANELTSDAPDLALADSFAPLMPDGSRSATYSDRLYQTFVDSLTTPGQQHVYNSLMDLATLVAGYRCPAVATPSPDGTTCKDHNFAGLESLTVIVPAKPNSPCDYVYADDMVTQVLPQEYCTYTFFPTGISPDKLQEQAVLIDPSKLEATVSYERLIQKLFSIP